MRYDAHFSVNVAGVLVSKDAKVSLNTVYDADRKETFQLSVNTLISRDEYSALVQAEMRRREDAPANSSP